MITRFLINDEIFNYEPYESHKKYYEEHYKKHGFVLDEEMQDCYKDFNRQIDLNVGDRVYLNGYRVIESKVYEVDEDRMEYRLEEE